jgi:1-phosphatidylinositol-3-phosphate 5-kinase
MSKADINFSQENLFIVNKIITEEGSRFRVSLRDEYCVVSDYEEELSSLIACALACLKFDGNIMPLTRSTNGSLERSFDKDQVSKQTVSSEGPKFESLTSPEILVNFGLADSNGKAKYSVVSLYAKDFYDLRNHCCFSELDYIDLLSRCERWDYAKEGTKKSIFFKTLNDRFIVKEIQRIEYESFVKFGPEYFKYMKDAYELGSQTCMVKVFGIYKVIIRQPDGHGEIQHNLMVMENLNFGRNISHEYNLKGSLLTQFTTTTGDGAEEVMLGPKFFKDMKNSPVYFSKDSKHNLQSAVTNDINFLHSINVMDYSLLVGVDLERRELVCGIIDYFKQYTWDLSYPCCIL